MKGTTLKRRPVWPAVLLLFLIVNPATDYSNGPSAPNPGTPGHPETDFDDYIWPTDAGPVITSTFAEYRRAHFHGGIDISTGNDTGFLVYASRDGYVSRISVSPDGYGKMLYVRHRDGYSTTYAHLRNFAPEIDERVRLEQGNTGAYPVSIRCGPGEFPVRKGDVIAYTGETGVGSPHLHFEIRDPENDFVNPLQCKEFPNIDSIRPTIRRLAVRPVGISSRVDGSWEAKTYRVRSTGHGSYRVSDPVRITGGAGFAIDVRDQSEQTYYRQGIHSLTLEIDGEPMYTVVLNNAPSRKSHHSGLYYDWRLADAGLGRFQRLYTESFPNSLSFFSPQEDSAGIVNATRFGPGEHQFLIRTTDRGGNSSELSGTLVLQPVPGLAGEDSLLKGASSGSGKALPAGAGISIIHETVGPFVRLHVRTTGHSDVVPRVKVYEGSEASEVPLRRAGSGRYVGTFIPIDSIGGMRRAVALLGDGASAVTAFDEFELYPLVRGRTGTYFAAEGDLIISCDTASVLSTLFMEIVPDSFEGHRTYRLEPRGTVLDDGFVVSMRADTAAGNSGLMLHKRTGWTLLARQSEPRSGMLTGRISQMLGEIGIIRDTRAPILNGFRVRHVRSGYPQISVRFDDGFSGIEYKEFKMYIDDEPVIPEIDGEHNRAVYIPSTPISKGYHQVTIRAVDKLGNSRELRNRFLVR